MKKKLQQAIEAGDVPSIRSILIDMVTAKDGSVSSLEDMAGAIAATKNLFVKDDGKVYASSARELTATEIEALRVDVTHNFSVQKFTLLAEVHEIERTHPSYFKNRVQEVDMNVDYAEDTLTIKEEIVADRVVVAEVSDKSDKSDKSDSPDSSDRADSPDRADSADRADRSDSADTADSSDRADRSDRSDKSGRAVKICGYVVILLGLLTSIVGLGIPVRFMIGSGIGAMMLGAGIVYMAINQKRNS